MQRPPLPSSVPQTGAPTHPPITHPATALNPPGARPAGQPSDPAVDVVLSAILDIKNNIFGLLQYIETQAEFLSWPLIMDRFSLISSQLSNLAKTMKSERFPDFRKIGLVPYFVSQDPDPAVERITEGRITAVNHENVPSYLRTKLDPEVENRFEQAISKVPQNLPPEAAQKADKQLQHLNKVVTALIEQLETARNEWDSKVSKSQAMPSYNASDTTAILAAIHTGKGLPAHSGFTGSRPNTGPSTSNPGMS